MKQGTLIALCCMILMSACSLHSSNEIDLAPSAFGEFLQDNFDDYVAETRQWVRAHRVFRSDDHELEIAVNSPFENTPDRPTQKAILLVHGLSDSPYSFSDLSERLAAAGFTVRSLLLPGHGAKPADLKLTELEDWLALVRHHTRLLMQTYDEVWLGGFSTGANLALNEAIENHAVAGVLLFSPAIDSAKPLDFLAPWAAYLMDWADVDPETSMTRFDSLTMNGAALYYQSAKLVRNKLAKKAFDRPMLMTLSEHDSVVDAERMYHYFDVHFTHPNRQLVWFGERDWEDHRVTAYSMSLPEKRISTGSHMSVLYAPNNLLYGEQGRHRICNNGQSASEEQACNEGAVVWYSAFDYKEAGKIHARLTWNPYFDETLSHVISVLDHATMPIESHPRTQ